MMALIEVLTIVLLLALIGYAIFALGSTSTTSRAESAPIVQRWVATHYAVGPTTRVVVRKLGLSDEDVLDEYVIADIPTDEPQFDTKFLDAMAEARARAALFESESD